MCSPYVYPTDVKIVPYLIIKILTLYYDFDGLKMNILYNPKYAIYLNSRLRLFIILLNIECRGQHLNRWEVVLVIDGKVKRFGISCSIA